MKEEGRGVGETDESQKGKGARVGKEEDTEAGPGGGGEEEAKEEGAADKRGGERGKKVEKENKEKQK